MLYRSRPLGRLCLFKSFRFTKYLISGTKTRTCGESAGSQEKEEFPLASSTFAGVTDGVQRVLALTKTLPAQSRRCVEKIIGDGELIDLNAAVNAAVGRAESPFSAKGLHQRGIVAVRAVKGRENVTFPFPPIVWPREAEEFCNDRCCIDRALVQQSFFLGYSDPLEDVDGLEGNRHVAVVGYMSLTPAICSNDFFIFSSHSRKRGERSTFALVGAQVGADGRKTGIRVDANPCLYTETHQAKRRLTAQVGECRPEPRRLVR